MPPIIYDYKALARELENVPDPFGRKKVKGADPDDRCTRCDRKLSPLGDLACEECFRFYIP